MNCDEWSKRGETAWDRGAQPQRMVTLSTASYAEGRACSVSLSPRRSAGRGHAASDAQDRHPTEDARAMTA
ncbi:MAG: hypothetical protein K0S45_2747 [Nitrospira sp.]|nr:hypothetical protein [Nitrospira sp.]